MKEVSEDKSNAKEMSFALKIWCHAYLGIFTQVCK